MKIQKISALSFAALLGFASLLMLAPPVSAASLTTTSLRLNRMSAGQSTTARLVFKTAAAGATSVTINMNGADSATWTTTGSGAVSATQTASSATCVAETAGATALPGTLASTAGNAGTGVITITPVTALAAATTYCVDLTTPAALTLPTAGEYHPVITAGADSTTVAVRTVTNDSVVVTAVVAPTFNFALNLNADAFTANLSPAGVGTTGGVTATVNTNAKTGWMAWAKDSGTGLVSAAATKTIASTTPGTSATLTAGTEGYVMGITNISQGSGNGVTSPIAAYDATGAAMGSGLDASYRQIATSTGTASTATFQMKERAAINQLTPAASDYTDTITIIGAGNF